MLIDSHIHVGQFFYYYFAPSTISQLMELIGIDYYAVASTTQCEENYPQVLSELNELLRIDGDKVLPILWITPEALKGNIAWYLESDIKWKMIKIHPFLNQTEWNPKKELFAEVLDIARELCLPLMIHTGNEDCCKADLYEEAIKNNHDITFVLAHGRPIESALKIANNYDNAFVDSAFMPIEHMKLFATQGLSEKILWGTDMCIPKYYQRDIDLAKYYKAKLQALQNICSIEQYEQITYKNAKELFLFK